jgi:hypothetical protein
MPRFPALLLIAGLLSALAAPVALGGLPGAGWPQSRRDARLSGCTPEYALRDPFIIWMTDTFYPFWGEPVVAGCRVTAVNGRAEIVSLDLATGAVAWTALDPYELDPSNAQSALAFDDSGLLLAGLPGEPVASSLCSSIQGLNTALESYRIDFGVYPAGPDLESELVPTYIRNMPWNPFALRTMEYSGTPSLGDYRYERAPTPTDYAFGVWWSDGKFACGLAPCGALPAGWPMTPELGGRPSGRDPADGTARFTLTDTDPATAITPVLANGWVLWTAAEEPAQSPQHAAYSGRIRATGLDGATLWERATWGPLRGGAARNQTTGESYAARGPGVNAGVLDAIVRSLGTAVESYQVDWGNPPRVNDLEPVLVPIYLACMPEHPVENRPVRYSAAPSPGDYTYDFDMASDWYEVTVWGEDGAPAARFSEGLLVQPAVNTPPLVFAHDASGNLKWRSSLGTWHDDLSPPALHQDGFVVVGTRTGDLVGLELSDGSERFRTPAGGPLGTAPALGADGKIVALAENGILTALDSAGALLWQVPTGAPAQAPPTLTADGIVYAPGLDGVLRYFDGAGGFLWQLPLGGVRLAGLSAAAVQSDGWLFVGRNDGVFIALAPASTRGGPRDVGNTLFLTREADDVVLQWTSLPMGPIPAACSYVVRKSDAPRCRPTDPVAAGEPASPARDGGAVSGGPTLAYYRVRAATCCGVEGP